MIFIIEFLADGWGLGLSADSGGKKVGGDQGVGGIHRTEP